MKIEKKEINRRKFIASLICGGVLINSRLSFGKEIESQLDPRVAEIVVNAMAIDTHNHVDVRIYPDQPLPKYDLLADFQKSGLAAIVLTFAVDYQKLQNDGDGYNRFMAGLDATDNLLKEYDLKRTLNLSGLKSAVKRRNHQLYNPLKAGIFLKGK